MAVLASILQKLGKLRRQDMRKLRNRQLERGEIRIKDINLYRPSKLQCFGKINRFLDETT